MILRKVASLIAPTAALIAVGALANVPPRRVPPVPKEFRLHGDASKGQAVYVSSCASCHGKKGDGRGVAGLALVPPPAAFDDAKRMAGVTDWELFLAVFSGGPSVGLAATMPPWAGTLTEQQIHDVVAFVKTMMMKPKPKAP